MSKRNYNVFFHTHTVSGIVISVALYIIFFAGAFALFKDEILVWEEGKAIKHVQRNEINYDSILEILDTKYDLTGRDIEIDLAKEEDNLFIYLLSSKDSLASESAKTPHFFSFNITTNEEKRYHEYYGIGEFLYRLHFFHQIPTVGIYLAGFIAFFFLFAIVTGTIVHWKKIVLNFYKFNPKIALKRVWADAHTSLGIIGLPFQFMFAVTGAYFCLSLLVLLPANFLYEGNQTKLLEDLRPERKTYEWSERINQELPSVNSFVKEYSNTWSNFSGTHLYIRNYKGDNCKYVLQGNLADKDRFVGLGRVVYDAVKKEVITVKNPKELNYIEDVQKVLTRLHFGNFGGVLLKVVYFILALITCFVIITGVLIWVEARNKKSATLQQQLFVANVGHVYLAICLSMLPVTAISFLFVKLFGDAFSNKQESVYYCYFILWIIAAIYMRFQQDNYKINKQSLLIGGISALCIPVVNGFVSNQWVWKSIQNKQHEILTIDLLWLCIGIVALWVYSKISPSIQQQSSFSKNPINYKELSEINRVVQSDNKSNNNNKNYISMRTKIISLWTLLVIGFMIHHIYGLANVYFTESLMMEGATGETPNWVHKWRIGLEGLAFLFAILTVQFSQNWFKWTSLIWACLLGLFNVYHFITALIYEPSNISEILILLLMVVANAFLIKELFSWKSE
jgi:uncharacterized iron-regulated membrane protein